MAKVTYNIDLSITDDDLEKIYTELGDAEPTEENITATPTFLRILDRLYAQMVKTDEENKKNEAMEQRRRATMNRNIPKFYVCDEMQKLRDGLDERKIPWKDLTDKDGLWICRTHFRIKGDRWSVVHGYGSYGGFNSFEKDKQLLECMHGGGRSGRMAYGGGCIQDDGREEGGRQ